MLQIIRAKYEVKKINPTKISIKTKEENLIIQIFFIPIAVFVTSDYKSISPIINPVIAIDTDKPKYGELCSPIKISSHTPEKIEEQKILDEGGTEIYLNENEREYLIKGKITNLNIYTDLRDQLGNPCVNISWTVLTIAK
ncbi:hypothetical protein V6M85_12475 [Sulfolobus tengchongensis]|uniref:Uncharacterized protein n=1 Tax=Sulfolobus tengchongensis TaxID=207809 RepID=A0AAX4L256_9CREN